MLPDTPHDPSDFAPFMIGQRVKVIHSDRIGTVKAVDLLTREVWIRMMDMSDSEVGRPKGNLTFRFDDLERYVPMSPATIALLMEQQSHV